MGMLVCKHCLVGIESHEGKQIVEEHDLDFEENIPHKCEWCEDEDCNILYEIL